MLERTDPRDLPPWPWLVRRHGKAVAAYRDPAHAHQHAAPHEDARVTAERMAVGVPPPHRRWQVDAAVRARDAAMVEALAGWWLAGGNNEGVPHR